MRTKPPCYGCDKRSPDCHADCSGYAAFRQEIETRKETIAYAYITNDYMHDKMRRAQHKAHLKTKVKGGKHEQ